MELKAYERIKFANNLRPLLIKDKCECCEKTEKLELHHDKQFAEMLKETLDRLGYEYNLRKEDYTREQLENITDMLLGIHIKSTYTTLCEKCHTEIHKNGELAYNFLLRKNSEKARKEKELDVLVLRDLLNQLIGIKMFKEEQNKFKESLSNLYDPPKKRNNSIGLNLVNKFLEENNIRYEFKSYKETSRKSENYSKMYWMINKIPESEVF